MTKTPCVIHVRTDLFQTVSLAPPLQLDLENYWPGITINLPAIFNVHVFMRDDRGSSPFTCGVRLSISCNDETLALTRSGGPQELKQLLTDLGKNVCHVVEQVTGGMVFERPETASKYISEALLRVVCRDSRLAAVSSIRVSLARIGKGGSTCISDAVWRTGLVDSKVPIGSSAEQLPRNKAADSLPLPKDKLKAERTSDAATAHASVISLVAPTDRSATGNILDGDTTLMAVTPARGGVFIALGSNMGDRLDAIEAACRAIDAAGDMRIIQTSFMYETAAMYVEDQARFLNAVCEVTFSLLTPMAMSMWQHVRRY